MFIGLDEVEEMRQERNNVEPLLAFLLKRKGEEKIDSWLY